MMMDSNPLVTVGIPVYNVGKYIWQSLNSVLSQTYSNLEVIITDDGSSDNTLEILSKINDPRIIILSDGINRGISFRLNQQICLAKGKYFFRMDGDDLMFPNRVEKLVEYLEANPAVDVIGSSAIIIDDDSRIIGKRVAEKKDRSLDSIFRSGLFIHPTVAGKTSWFRKWQYKEDMSGVEDIDLWIRSFSGSVIAEYEMPLLFYRDPLKFKIKTYKLRQKKLINCFSQHKGELSAISYCLNCLIKPTIALWLSTALALLGLDEWMISRRNQKLSNDEELHYYSILQDLLLRINLLNNTDAHNLC